MVCVLLKATLPRYNVTWDVEKVLSFLANMPSIDEITLKRLTYKVTVLLGLLSGQRVQSLHLMSIKNIEFIDNVVKIRIGDLLKHSRPAHIYTKSLYKNMNLIPTYV